MLPQQQQYNRVPRSPVGNNYIHTQEMGFYNNSTISYLRIFTGKPYVVHLAMKNTTSEGTPTPLQLISATPRELQLTVLGSVLIVKGGFRDMQDVISSHMTLLQNLQN